MERETDTDPVGWPALRDRPPDAGLLALVESRSLASLDSGELVDVLAALKRLTIRCEALGLTAADTLRRQLAAEDPDLEADPSGDPTDHAATEVAAALAETRYRSSVRLHLVRRISTELPRVWGLVTAGRLDMYSAEQIHSELSVVADKSLIPGLEAKIVAALHAATPSDAARASSFGLVGANPTRTRRLVRRLVAKAEPDATDEKFRRAYADRGLRTETDDTAGMGQLWLGHSIDRILGIGHRLGLIARSLPADDPRTMDQKVADVACDILEGKTVADSCTSLLEDGEDPRLRSTGARRRIQVNITVPIETVMGFSNAPGETLAGDIVPASLVRQLAADRDSVWYRMLTDRGRFVELSTHTYTPTAEQKRSTHARDRTCVGVGCNHPADSCDIDHTHAWADHGETREGNLGPGCRKHHNSKDNGGRFHLTQPEPGLFRWTYPSGHTYTTTADAYPESNCAATMAPEWQIPASAADVTEGLQLLDHKRRREAAQRDWLTHRSILEQRLVIWRKDCGEAFEEPDDAGTDDHLYIPTETLESWVT
ncbi:MAG TPA: DUF222 domain-containing protein [Nocardioidaceae bacterium]|nr:DUF222 domain-containing protein [Nocardioidaceae bacterium]